MQIRNVMFIIRAHTGNDLNLKKKCTPLIYFKLKTIFKFLIQFVTVNNDNGNALYSALLISKSYCMVSDNLKNLTKM